MAAAEVLSCKVAALNATIECTPGGWSPFIDPAVMNSAQILFMTCIYGLVLFTACDEISAGSELLLLVPQFAGIVGSVVLPVLGALPDGMMVLCSGLGPDAQEKVAVGVGALAGSTIMLLTLPWFLAVLAGRVSLRADGELNYKRPPNAPAGWEKRLTNDVGLTTTGISFSDEVPKNAKVMMLTCSSYFIIQFATFSARSESKADQVRAESPWAAAGMVVCLVLFAYYMYTQWLQSQDSGSANEVNKKATEITVQAMRDGHLTLRGAMATFRESDWANLCETEGGLDEVLLDQPRYKSAMDEIKRMCKVLAPFFARYDMNGDNQIDKYEFGMIFKDVNENVPKETQDKMFEAADTDNSGNISFEEFVACLMSFALDPADSKLGAAAAARKYMPSPSTYYPEKEADDGDGEAPEEEDMPEDLAGLDPEEQQKRVKLRAFRRMAWGSLLVLLFSDPMVDLLSAMGDRSGVPAFYVSFVLAPLASNASELLAAYTYAKKKTIGSMTTSLSCLLGAAIMNNTFCLGIFLGLVYFKGLAWTFSAETISIVLVQILIFGMLLKGKSQTLLDAAIILCFYPMSLLVVWFLEHFMD